MIDKYQEFLGRLTGSPPAVLAFARHLNLSGQDIEMPGLHYAENQKDSEKYRDGGDLFIVQRTRIEVKGIGKIFSGLHDFPYQNVMFSSRRTVEENADKVEWWVVVSGDFRAAAMIHKNTREHWKLVTIEPRNTQKPEEQYWIDKNLVEWRTLKA